MKFFRHARRVIVSIAVTIRPCSYERGQAKPNAESLHALAEALQSTTDYLLDGSADNLAQDRLSDRDLLRQFQELEKLPETKKQTVKDLVAAFIFEHKVMAQAAGR